MRKKERRRGGGGDLRLILHELAVSIHGGKIQIIQTRRGDHATIEIDADDAALVCGALLVASHEVEAAD
jgi:hypothetical protein